jgi:hypothetical protein
MKFHETIANIIKTLEILGSINRISVRTYISAILAMIKLNKNKRAYLGTCVESGSVDLKDQMRLNK